MKKWGTFVLCAVLITGLISRTVHLVSAQEEIQTEEAQVEESSSQDSTEPTQEAEEQPEGSHNDEEEQEEAGEQPEQSESESLETSEESESIPSRSLPDEPDSKGENLPVSETEESGEIQTEKVTPGVIEGETPKEIQKGIPGQKENESNQAVVEAMQAAHDGLNEHIDYIANLLHMSDGYTLKEGEDNFCEALAIYAIRHEQTGNYPYGIEITGEEDSTELQSIFWSLNAVNGVKTEGDSVICVAQFSAVNVYNLSDSQEDVLKKLNSQKSREKVSGLIQESHNENPE